MKTYRIKNPDIEKAVRGLFKTQEAFEKELNHWSEHHFKYHAYLSYIKIEANSAESITGFTCELYVATSDIEEVVEYDPAVWNEYPKVKPPKEGNYLVTAKTNQMLACLPPKPVFEVAKAKYYNGEWRGLDYGWQVVAFHSLPEPYEGAK